MYCIITENMPGNLHQAADYINHRPSIYAETLMALAPISEGGCVAVYKVPTNRVRWVWGDLGRYMDQCPVDN